MPREEVLASYGFECPYQHRCPHLCGMSVHHAGLVVKQAPFERAELFQRIEAFRNDLQHAPHRIGQLEKECAHFKAQWQLVHRKQFKTNKPSTQSSTASLTLPPDGSTSPKKTGAPKGHPGWHRKRPGPVDQRVEVPAPKQCPECGNRSLQSIEERWEHLQEDIVLQPCAQVTLFDHRQAYCPAWGWGWGWGQSEYNC